jgi:molecular chaperone DnaK
LVHSVTKSLAEHSEKLDEATKTEVQAAIDAAKSVDASADLETLKTKVSELSSASMKIGQAMYGKKDANASGDSSSGANGGAKEAEYEEKKDEKK